MSERRSTAVADLPAASALPTKRKGMSQADHEAHHAKPKQAEATAGDQAVSFVSLVWPNDGGILRRVAVPRAANAAARGACTLEAWI